MKKLTRDQMKNVFGGDDEFVQSEFGAGCVTTGSLCNTGDICCDKTKGYQGKCESREGAKCE